MKKTATMSKLIIIGIVSMLLCSGMASVSAIFTDLYAGRDQRVVGDVHARRSGHLFLITYETDSGWSLEETHLAVANSFDEIPQTKKGNPKIGKFPYQAVHEEGTEIYTYVLNLYDYFPDGNWRGNTLYIAAHSVVTHPEFGEETAWADTWGKYFPGNSIALYFTFTF